MAIDITKDKLLSLEDAAKMFPKPGGGHIHPKTVKNWITLGYQGILLEGAQVGSKFYTTSEALRVFSKRLNERRQLPEAPKPAGAQPSVPKPRRAAHETDGRGFADDDFTVVGEETIAGVDTVSGGEFTVEMPCHPTARDSR